jgi:hypothetical protein
MPMTWDELVGFATTLPEVAASTSYGTPALKVAGTLMARLRADDADGALVLRCAPDEKVALVDGDDPAFFTTPHYDGHDSVLVDLDRVDADQLRELVDAARHVVAPARLRAERPA